jgi:hypothetical protein
VDHKRIPFIALDALAGIRIARHLGGGGSFGRKKT